MPRGSSAVYDRLGRVVAPDVEAARGDRGLRRGRGGCSSPAAIGLAALWAPRLP